MTGIHKLPDATTAEREAGDWIARLNADEVSAEERTRFEQWRGAHPRHARAYEELSATWHELRDAGHLVRAVSFGNAMNVPARKTGMRWAFFASAAVLVATVAAGVLWFLQLGPQTQFQTAIGERASIQLPDGSSLELNSNSLARVEYSGAARVIRLKRGEAYFTVAHDTQRPFWVVAGASWVRAVGTAFNVHLLQTSVQVTVSEGVVKVAADRVSDTPSDNALANAPVSVLTAGQQMRVGGGATDIRSLPATALTRSVAWRQGVLYFDNEPLGAAVDELSRYTPMQIVIDEAALRDLPVGGIFQASPEGAQALLAMLEEGLGLRVRRDGNRRAHIFSAD